MMLLSSLMERLMINSIVIFALTGIIALIKQLLKNHLTYKAQHRIWYLLLFVLAIPFLPLPLLEAGHGLGLFGRLGGAFTPANAPASSPSYGTGITGLLEDFSISVSRRTSLPFQWCLPYLWVLGIGVTSLVNIISEIRIRQVRQVSLPLQNRQIKAVFDSCLREMGIKKEIPVYSSACLSSPVAAGFIKPVIIIPMHMLSEFTEREIRYILLHELTHIKHRDLYLNRLLALAQVLYWFHPAVWLGLREMRKDLEVSCDLSVLSMLEESSYLDYGKTLIRFAEKVNSLFSPAAGIGGTKKEIFKRILCIAAYRKESVWVQWKSRIILVLCGVLLLAITPVISSHAAGSSYQFHSDHVTQLDLNPYFYGYNGSFVLYEIHSGKYYIYNQEAAATRVSPDSTYKIYSALCALDHGIITPDSSNLKWDGSPYPFKAWNRDQTLDTAMSHSVNWYFKALDEKNGITSLKNCIAGLNYGNQDLSGGLGNYWLESSLKISPVEQAELLTRLYQGTLPFKPDHIKAVKDSLYLSSSQGVSLYGKTGTGTINGKNRNGWFIGFAESGEETYIFATNILNDHSANGPAAAAITLNILKDQNIYQQ